MNYHQFSCVYCSRVNVFETVNFSILYLTRKAYEEELGENSEEKKINKFVSDI